MAATVYYNFSGGTPNYSATLTNGVNTYTNNHVAEGEYSFLNVVNGTYDLTIEDQNGCIIEKTGIVVNCGILPTTTTTTTTTTTAPTTTTTTTTIPTKTLSWDYDEVESTEQTNTGTPPVYRYYYYDLDIDSALTGGQVINMTLDYVIELDLGILVNIGSVSIDLSKNPVGDIDGVGNLISDSINTEQVKTGSATFNVAAGDTVRLLFKVELDGTFGEGEAFAQGDISFDSAFGNGGFNLSVPPSPQVVAISDI